MKPQILLVEDEENLSHVLKMNLEMEGYAVDVADNGKSALKLAREYNYQLYILDVMIPHINGYDVCEQIRKNDLNTPILFLTARDTGKDRVMGLKMGADDYLTKPFNLEELLLRTKILLRRSPLKQPGTAVGNTFEFGNNTVNFHSMTATHNGTEHQLTKRESQLLKFLIEHEGEVISRQEILKHVWELEANTSQRSIDNFIRALRVKFEDNPEKPRFFQSVHGVGYRFTMAGG